MSSSHLKPVEDILPGLIARLDHALHGAAPRAQPAADPANDPGSDPADVLGRHLDALADRIETVTRAVNEVLSPALQRVGNPDTTRSAVRTFERTVDELLFGFEGARRIVASADWQPALDLLVDAYRQVLLQIRGWLVDVLAIATDPAAALRQRGRDPDAPDVSEIALTWNVDSPPALDALRTWAEQRRVAIETSPTHADGAAHHPPAAAHRRAWLEAALAVIVFIGGLYLFVVWPGTAVMLLVLGAGWLLWLLFRYPLLALLALLFGIGG